MLQLSARRHAAGLLGIAALRSWLVAALPACYQLPYSPFCCVGDKLVAGETLSFPMNSPQCQGYGQGLLARTGYLKAQGDPHGVYQEAFLKQGIYNTMHYVDCKTQWLGVNVRQPPQDMLAIQELVFRLRPKLVVETGTGTGGFAFFIASLFHLMDDMDDARIVTIDERQKELNHLKKCPGRPKTGIGSLARNKLWKHYVREVVSDSVSVTSQAIVKEELGMRAPGSHVLISLDANHMKSVVWKEIMAYASLVTVGSYLIVQDVILSFARYPWDGPLGAAEELVNANETVRRRVGTFVRDDSVAHYGYTGHMYFLRVA